jgi:hypothetical protein
VTKQAYSWFCCARTDARQVFSRLLQDSLFYFKIFKDVVMLYSATIAYTTHVQITFICWFLRKKFAWSKHLKSILSSSLHWLGESSVPASNIVHVSFHVFLGLPMSRLPEGQYLQVSRWMRVCSILFRWFSICLYILLFFHIKGDTQPFLYPHFLAYLSQCNLWQYLNVSFLLLEFCSSLSSSASMFRKKNKSTGIAITLQTFKFVPFLLF